MGERKSNIYSILTFSNIPTKFFNKINRQRFLNVTVQLPEFLAKHASLAVSGLNEKGCAKPMYGYMIEQPNTHIIAENSNLLSLNTMAKDGQKRFRYRPSEVCFDALNSTEASNFGNIINIENTYAIFKIKVRITPLSTTQETHIDCVFS